MNKMCVADRLLDVQGKLRVYARQITGSRDEALDLLQETNLKVLECAVMYKDDTNFAGWAATIMKRLYLNKCNEWYTRSNEMLTDAIAKQWEASTDCSSDVESLYDVGVIMEIVEAQKGSYKEALKMFMNGYSYEEIATKEGIPMGSVKSRLNIVRNRIKNQISVMF